MTLAGGLSIAISPVSSGSRGGVEQDGGKTGGRSPPMPSAWRRAIPCGGAGGPATADQPAAESRSEAPGVGEDGGVDPAARFSIDLTSEDLTLATCSRMRISAR